MQLPKNLNYDKKAVENFKSEMLNAMKDFGATEDDFAMFEDEELLNDIVITAMFNGQKPGDVAWAVLQ